VIFNDKAYEKTLLGGAQPVILPNPYSVVHEHYNLRSRSKKDLPSFLDYLEQEACILSIFRKDISYLI